jgi:phosphatidylserine decarboxylase
LRGIPIAKEGLPLIALSFLLSLLLFLIDSHPAILILGILVFLFFLFCLYFFRNPSRHPEEEGNILTSPADGKVTEIRDIFEEEFLKGEATRISIFMSPADVHVNRAPCEGRVAAVEHRRGDFAVAFKKDIEKENERNYILLECRFGPVLLVQIAGFLARRIICYVKEGVTVRRGEAVGMIAFGSRVDIYIPRDYEPVVRLNQRVKAGETTLARKRGKQ